MNHNTSENWSFWGRNMLTDLELGAIHQATLEVLMDPGVYVEEEEARDFFSNAGAIVDHDKKIVKIPKWMVEEAITSSPGEFVFSGRERFSDYRLENGRVGFSSISVAVNVRDMDNGEIRPSTKQDLRNYTRILDQLENYSICLYPLLPTDVPSESADIHALQVYLENTTKHITLCANDRITADTIIKMASVAAGGLENLIKHPLISTSACPKSPLGLTKEVTVGLMAFAKLGLPVMGMPMALSGGTSPVTLAGTLVQHNAEVLSTLVLTQIIKKGSPFCYASCTSVMDLRKAQCATGCVEHAMFAAALSRLSQYYNLPFVGPGCWTDSKITDMQSGYEKAMSALLPSLAGANIMFGGGCQTGGLVADFGALVTDNELYGMIQFILKGIKVNEETLALDVIRQVGIQGEYVTTEHSFKHMYDNQFWPQLCNRDSEAAWRGSGSKTIEERGLEMAKSLLENENPNPLSEAAIKEIEAIVADAEKQKGI